MTMAYFQSKMIKSYGAPVDVVKRRGVAAAMDLEVNLLADPVSSRMLDMPAEGTRFT